MGRPQKCLSETHGFRCGLSPFLVFDTDTRYKKSWTYTNVIPRLRGWCSLTVRVRWFGQFPRFGRPSSPRLYVETSARNANALISISFRRALAAFSSFAPGTRATFGRARSITVTKEPAERAIRRRPGTSEWGGAGEVFLISRVFSYGPRRWRTETKTDDACFTVGKTNVWRIRGVLDNLSSRTSDGLTFGAGVRADGERTTGETTMVRPCLSRTGVGRGKDRHRFAGRVDAAVYVFRERSTWWTRKTSSTIVFERIGCCWNELTEKPLNSLQTAFLSNNI